ncbi:hypothetical protein SBADM41S_05195 [Streptomyces badius]
MADLAACALFTRYAARAFVDLPFVYGAQLGPAVEMARPQHVSSPPMALCAPPSVLSGKLRMTTRTTPGRGSQALRVCVKGYPCAYETT